MELNTKLQVKLESLQERLTQSQHEVMLLKQQLETLRVSSLNAASADSHEHLSTVINSLRSDSERTKALLEERNNSLMEQVQRLKEESRNGENRRNTLDADLRRLHTQHAELAHKLSFAEAQLQVMQKTREQVEQEKSQLKEELHKANERHRLAQEKCLEAQTRLAELTDRLNRAEHTSQLSTQNLATTSASFTAVARSKEEIEDTVQRLQVDNARLEADLRHERERAIMLQADLDDSHKVRSSLEALCSNLKSTTAHLEEKLGIVHLEKAQKTAQSKLEQAKTQEHEAEGHKTAVEVQLSEECQKSQQLQKELSNLKAHLKAAKKKLKSQVESGQVDVEELQKEMEMRYRRELNSKLDEINTYLEAQAHARDRLDTSRTDNETRLAAETRHLQEENSNLKVQYEQAVAQRESREMEARRYKQLYESEMHWRMRLGEQLHLSADKTLHLNSRLGAQHKNRLQTGIGNVSMADASLHISAVNGDHNDALSHKIRAELNRSIAKHLEAAPHSNIVPVIRETEDSLLNHSLARSNKDYIDVLKRKYCVP